MPETELVNISINGVALQVPKGEKVIAAARRIGVDIPFFCYHPRLSMEAGANCRMCLVRMGAKQADGTIRWHPKLQASCSLPSSEGLVIETETDQVIAARKGMLEFLLINHPLDCPVCDRGGECPLQNNTLHYGPPTSRYIEEKRHFPKAYPLSDHVVFDRERCIHCARCTRFTSDISGDAQLSFLKRGADTEVGTFDGTTFKSRFSGNVIELCPVGALLSRQYRFKARPWDLMTQRSICTQCGNGCNIKLDYRVANLQRVNARVNEAVNEEWTCDHGKFGMAYVSSDDRLTTPLIRRDGQLKPASWDEALALVAARLKDAGAASGFIGGSHSSNEDAYMMQMVARQVVGTANIDSRLSLSPLPTSGGLFGRLGYHTMGNAIADFEAKRTILVLGSNLVDEQPIVYLRVRKAWRFHQARVFELVPNGAMGSGAPGHVRDFAEVSGEYRPGSEVALLSALAREVIASGSAANVDGLSELRAAVEPWTLERASNVTGVPADDIRRVAAGMIDGSAAVILGAAITGAVNAAPILDAVANLALLTGCGDSVNAPVCDVNGQGAMDMGVLPDAGPGYTPVDRAGMTTREMLDAAASGKLTALFVSVVDLAGVYADADLAKRALEACPFVVATAYAPNATTELADVVLPVQTVAERNGTFTSIERRVQRFWKAFDLAPDMRPEWLVLSDIAIRLGAAPKYYTARDVLRDIVASVPIYAGCGLSELGDQGVRWMYPDSAAGSRKLVVVEPAASKGEGGAE